MAGRTRELTGTLILRESTGESFERLQLLSPEEGIQFCLYRRPKRLNTQSRPDLFDELELFVEQKDGEKGQFVKELKVNHRRRGIGKSFAALQSACDFATLLQKNHPDEIASAEVHQLLTEALLAWEQGKRADVVYFKTLFRYTRLEGYPVKQDWFERLKAFERREVAPLVNLPSHEVPLDKDQVRHWIEKLHHYVEHYTDLLI